jgi:hypothetical protein
MDPLELDAMGKEERSQGRALVIYINNHCRGALPMLRICPVVHDPYLPVGSVTRYI